jgi:hypothetical protein
MALPTNNFMDMLEMRANGLHQSTGIVLPVLFMIIRKSFDGCVGFAKYGD